MMSRTRALVVVLRFFGVVTLLAIFAVFMPTSWMASTHRWLGLGELPAAPIVENLARSVSTFYAIFGAICLALAADVERYRPLIRFLGILVTLFGMILIGTDLSAGLPLWWTASEGLSTLVLGVLMFVLSRADE